MQSYSLPPNIRECNVILVDSECVTGVSACQAIEVLRSEGVAEDVIYFVCVIASAKGVQAIASAFPNTHIVTATVDPNVDNHHNIVPGCGRFLDRYYDSEVVFGRLA
uniref:Phosphoribosyltransferase domain-containing protein n=1 Tax=Globisporangium ultimum (strain ATCC 200006 / CBS 805.95 / DAOM BR144) TaxID=431595 RepID=K3X828_GLOUD